MNCSTCGNPMNACEVNGKPSWVCLPCGAVLMRYGDKMVPQSAARNTKELSWQVKVGNAVAFDELTYTRGADKTIEETVTFDECPSHYGARKYIIDLPYPVGTNNLFATVMRGNKHIRVKSEAGKAFCYNAGMTARQLIREPLTGNVSIRLEYSPKSGHGYDVDNVAKCALDAMKGIAWVDDEQVWHLDIWRKPAVKGGRFTMMIEEME